MSTAATAGPRFLCCAGNLQDPYDNAAMFARALDATCYYVTAPMLAETADLRELLLNSDPVREVLQMTRKLDMAIAGGENEFTKFGFRRILEKRAMDIVQPDVCAAGGITECKKIAALAQASSVQCVPHAWGTAIGLAATMHYLASLPFIPNSVAMRCPSSWKPLMSSGRVSLICWLSWWPCEWSTSKSRRFGFWSYVCTKAKHLLETGFSTSAPR